MVSIASCGIERTFVIPPVIQNATGMSWRIQVLKVTYLLVQMFYRRFVMFESQLWPIVRDVSGGYGIAMGTHI